MGVLMRTKPQMVTEPRTSGFFGSGVCVYTVYGGSRGIFYPYGSRIIIVLHLLVGFCVPVYLYTVAVIILYVIVLVGKTRS